MLHRREENGLRAVEALSALLLRQRAEGPLAGIYDAGDVQWWWKDEWKDGGSQLVVRTRLWSDDSGSDIAWMRAASKLALSGAIKRTDVDFGWLAGASGEAVAEVVAALQDLATQSSSPVATVTDERDNELSDRLTSMGFVRTPESDYVQMWQQPTTVPAKPQLPSGFRFEDDRSRNTGHAHHLAQRNGPEVSSRLREVSLYRPDLDLCVRDGDGTTAAYCLCWLDTANSVGMFEPVRTEDAFQRRGLGQALMAEGIRRLLAAGASTIRVAREADAGTTAAFYRRGGFIDGFRNLGWQRSD